MDILRLQQEAKDRAVEESSMKIPFYLSAPKGVFDAKWLDPYFGFFEIPAIGDGFLTAQSLPANCEAFWDRAAAEKHNEAFTPLRELNAAIFGDTQ